MKKRNRTSKKNPERIVKHLYKELKKAYESTDYSNYEIKVTYDAEDNMLIVPLPVLALACVDEEIYNWINELVEKYSANGFKVPKAS